MGCLLLAGLSSEMCHQLLVSKMLVSKATSLD